MPKAINAKASNTANTIVTEILLLLGREFSTLSLSVFSILFLSVNITNSNLLKENLLCGIKKISTVRLLTKPAEAGWCLLG